MTFLILIPTLDQYPQRLCVKNFNSWKTACPDKFWHLLLNSDQKRNVLIPRGTWSREITEPFRQENIKISDLGGNVLHGYIQLSNLSSALIIRLIVKGPSIYYVSKRTVWVGLENGQFCWRSVMYSKIHQWCIFDCIYVDILVGQKKSTIMLT